MALSPTSSRPSGLGAVVVSGTPSVGQVLTATSATAASWSSPSTGSVTLLASVLLASNTTIGFSSISQAYRHLWMVGSIQASDGGATQVRRASIRFNADTGANYSWQLFEGASNVTASSPNSGTSSAAIGNVRGAAGTSVELSPIEVLIPNYANAANKVVLSKVASNYGTTANWETQLTGAVWVATAAITQIDFVQTGGNNFLSGSRVDLYGIL